MYFKQCLQLVFLALLSFPLAADETNSPPISLKLTPETCVALQQGRLCYANVNISWQSNEPQDLCLKIGQQQLQCWQASRSGQLRYEFVGQETTEVQLVNAEGELVKALIKVNWVQKNPKIKRHWRLF